jgi:hypothetical protein
VDGPGLPTKGVIAGYDHREGNNTVTLIWPQPYAGTSATLSAIRKALVEKAGVEFTNGKKPGVRLKWVSHAGKYPLWIKGAFGAVSHLKLLILLEGL